MCRQFKASKYMFMYKQINSNDEDTDIMDSEKIGGIFEIVNPD